MPQPSKSYAPSRITIDTAALQANYKILKSMVGIACQTAAVVKANAYGTGVDVAVPALVADGAEFFYVAQFGEALEVRRYTNAPIAVLGGLPRGAAADFKHHHITPVLNSPEDIENCPADLPAIWHIDTGMNRLGLPPKEIAALITKSKAAPLMFMTHFTASEDTNNPHAEHQVDIFDRCISQLDERFHIIPHSICNSSGVFRNSSWHRAQVRPGIALYGANPTPGLPNPMSPVVKLEAQILQTRSVKAGETAGYNQTYTFPEDTTTATVGLGYADGFLRSGSNKAHFYWFGHPCPIVGRVSMDLIILDIGKIPSSIPRPQQGDWLEVLGPHQSVDQLASDLGTIGYEILTSLSRRAERKLIGIMPQ
ncbi:MAG: alanine racemase [Pseudobdellovibrionaceae bacterium]